jgi:hypothetical protein
MSTHVSPDNEMPDELIRSLTTDLKPVRPLLPPTLRAGAWLAAVALTAIGLALFSDRSELAHRLSAAPDMWLAVVGSTATTVLAALAAFELSLPDRSRAWALLPVPAALLWILASGAGCLRTWFIPDTSAATMGEEKDCMLIIVGLSVPLSALLIVMLRRAFSFEPTLTALMAGLAAASAAATLLVFLHPFDATASDLSVHAVAVALVIVANRYFGGRLFALRGAASNRAN